MNCNCLSFDVWVYVSQITLQELFSGGAPSDSGMREVVVGGAGGCKLFVSTNARRPPRTKLFYVNIFPQNFHTGIDDF